MYANTRRMMLLTLISIGLVAVSVAAHAQPTQTSGIVLSNLSVTPSLASKGTTVTGSVTVQNLDDRNSVTVVVTFYDGGVATGSNSATVAKGRSSTIQLDFAVIVDGPHCYAVQANPGPVSAGFCEPGGFVLGGAEVSTFNPALAIVSVVTTSLAAGGLFLALRRRWLR